MKIARFQWGDGVRWGVLDGDELREIEGDRFNDPRPGAAIGALSDARLLAPIEPADNKVVGIAANYGEVDGRDGPGIFMKPPGTNIGHLESIVYPRTCSSIIHEAEVGIVIGRAARRVSPKDALDHVFGYTCTNDVTVSKFTTSDTGRGGTMRMKYYDTFCPIGPVIATGLDGDNRRVQCRVNGATEIDSSSSDMIFDVAHLVAWVSEVMALSPGDIISSGCPDVGEIEVGDTVEVEVEGVGVLTNPVVADF
jgi:2-keto-4-pentenoate hydratase/2-oxohepta-3-ene-1,7-dioic acid hydratase in catechol pathway